MPVTVTIEVVVEDREAAEALVQDMAENIIWSDEKYRYAMGSFIPVEDEVEYYTGVGEYDEHHGV